MNPVSRQAEMPSLPSDPEEFARLHRVIKPRPEERRWTYIPWEVDLWEARRRSLALGKPILLWAMNGHPLGGV
jgi:hypothetical protein